MPLEKSKPVLVITGATGNLGRTLAEEFMHDYEVVGLDRSTADGAPYLSLSVDLSSDTSVSEAMAHIAERWGRHVAAVIHLVAYFDSTGEENLLYQTVNVEGTRRLLYELKSFEVERFIYASTMLVHAPCKPGERISEESPYGPLYVYPRSKLQAEDVIRSEHDGVPYAILRFAGVYDETTVVPTLAQQIARIYERDFQSHFYSASTAVGQAMLHRDDMVYALRQTLACRKELPLETELLIGEADPLGYEAIQDEIGYLIHGQDEWPTLRLPKTVAAAGSWLQGKLEPVVPDALDQGQEPFIKPYMVAMSDAHYALDTRRAERLLGWRPAHHIKEVLPAIVAALKKNPVAWYQMNGMTPPPTIAEAAEETGDTERLRRHAEAAFRTEFSANRWMHFGNLALGTWLMTQAPLIGGVEPPLRWTEFGLGAAIVLFAALSMSWQMGFARWLCAGIGALVMAAPFVFWTANPAAYLADTLIGGIVIVLAVAGKPEPGTSPIARMSGPLIPPGWLYNPSAWTQRVPIVLLALVGLYVSRYLAAYQLEHIDSVWEPFFEGNPADPRNGTEEIITSSFSRAWPVPDAALGGYTYMLEIVTGVIGSRARWRTMPWLVVLFGFMIVPLGIVSIGFIIIQPIVIGTWSTLTLIAAAAMLLQIPYSLDELLAVGQFLRRRVKAGKPFLRVFLFGDTDEGKTVAATDEFDRTPGKVLSEMLQGGVRLPWNLFLAGLVGFWLMFTRLTLDTAAPMANADHVIGALILTVLALAAAEVTRALRYLLVPLGLALFATPFIYDATGIQTIASLLAGAALIALTPGRGRPQGRYGAWDAMLR